LHFVFYDFETTGRSPAFDQALQFAAIYTDEGFNEIDRVNIRCRLLPHILPAPAALKITGVDPADTLNSDLSSAFEFAQKLQFFTETWAPATWIGFNSINFDENFLRQIFYQNLQPNIFATQYHGNNRHDLMNIVYAVYTQHPTLLKWPENEVGKKVFKLDQLAPANGFDHSDAHDALADVEATIFILSLIRERHESFYDEIMEMRDKSHVKSILSPQEPVQVTLRYGSGAPKQYRGCLAGSQSGNGNSFGFFNIDQEDPAGLIMGDQSKIDEIVKNVPASIRTLQYNKSLIFLPVENPEPEILRVCDLIRENTEFQLRVTAALDRKFEHAEDQERLVEQKIFDLFDSPDKDLLFRFQDASWEERLELVLSMQDSRYRQLGMRLIASHAPQLLSNSQKDSFINFIRDRWSQTGKTDWETLEKVSEALNKMESGGEGDVEVLQNYRNFYNKRLQEAGIRGSV